MQNNVYGRILDPRTMTYSYRDGSGLITLEKVVDRKLLFTEIETLKAEKPRGKAKLALLIIRFLTFFSK